jgi:hypothetical protein
MQALLASCLMLTLVFSFQDPSLHPCNHLDSSFDLGLSFWSWKFFITDLLEDNGILVLVKLTLDCQLEEEEMDPGTQPSKTAYN